MDSGQENDPPSWDSTAGPHFDMLSPYRPGSVSFPTSSLATLPLTPSLATLQAFTTAQLSEGQYQQLTTVAGAFQPTFQVAAPSSSYERVSPVDDFVTTEVTPSVGSVGSLSQPQSLHLVNDQSTSRPLIAGYPAMLLASLAQQQFPLTTSTASLPNSLGGIGLAATPLGGTGATGLYVIADSSGRPLAQIPMDGSGVGHHGSMHQINARQLYTVVNYPPGSGPGAAMSIVGDQENNQTVTTLDLAEGHVTTPKDIAVTFTAQSASTELGTDPTVFAPPDSADAFPGATNSQLELSGQINLDPAQLVTATPQGLVLETGLHTQAMTNTITSGQLMESSPAAGGQVVAMVERSISVAMKTGAEADLVEMLAVASSHDPGLPMADMEAEGKGEDAIESHNLSMIAVRKSQRIAKMELSPTSVPRPVYVPNLYDVNQLWCEDCQTSYATPCAHHQQQPVYDKLVVSRAWASLPPQLQIFRFGEPLELGVFAKKPIPRRVQFGPYVADLVSNTSMLCNPGFILKLDLENGVHYLETTDENKCNWMMFVRPATTYAEQNLVAYQFGADICFTTIRDIEPKQELKVWYAAHYAENMGVKTHLVSEADQEALEAANLKWPCYECDKKFRTSAQLQKHLSVHDDTLHENPEDSVDMFDVSVDGSLKTNGRSAQRRRRGWSPKKSRDGSGDEPSTFQSWKKKLYLSKLKKYTRDSLKRPIKTLYKRKGKESGGNEWVCIHCDLTFDNPSLLNLHTLTHAAEDVGLEEMHRMGGEENGDVKPANGEITEIKHLSQLDGIDLECPVCNHRFDQKQQLIEHASEHAKTRRHRSYDSNPAKPFKCPKCWKAFTIEERLQRHMLCHGDEAAKPIECTVCFKRFMNNSAVACHMKIHSDRKYYECPLCRLGFDQIHALKVHTATHAVDGVYECPECHKTFNDYNSIRKHMRGFHSDKQFPCPQCNKVFPRPDKLKLHMLRHSNHREFMCESCGRQFKRKDKLKEHMKRMHHPDREMHAPVHPPHVPGVITKRFVPKVSPNDYHRFIYKCHACLLGFKRRGMLVNHLAKRHPDIKTESVPELNLPILQTQRDYYCQYCDKVYKSSSKRKGHILKNHPGAELPASARKKITSCGIVELSGMPNPTFSQTVGSVTTVPHPCEFCHKQYASKAKLMQHQRKKHGNMVPPAVERRKAMQLAFSTIERVKSLSGLVNDKLDDTVIGIQSVQPDHLQTADLLTQAMSELQQTLNEYRPQGTAPTDLIQMTPPRNIHGLIGSGTPIVMLQTTAGGQPAMIEFSQLQQLAPGQFQVAAPSQVQEDGGVEGVNAQTVVSAADVLPMTIAGSYVPRTWVPSTLPTPYTAFR